MLFDNKPTTKITQVSASEIYAVKSDNIFPYFEMHMQFIEMKDNA